MRFALPRCQERDCRELAAFEVSSNYDMRSTRRACLGHLTIAVQLAMPRTANTREERAVTVLPVA